MRPATGVRELAVGKGCLLGWLVLSLLGAVTELLFPELAEGAGILEAGKVGEVALLSPPGFLALPLACK